MKPPTHFRFLLDSVEFKARRTDAILYRDNRTFWEDIVDSWERREEKRSYWLFCVRWMREELEASLRRSSRSALVGILAILSPEDVPPATTGKKQSPALRRRLAASLLPVMVRESVVRVRKAALERFGVLNTEPAAFYPNDSAS